MTRGKKIGLAAVALVVVAVAIGSVRAKAKANEATEVRFEQVGRKDLTASVTASGKIQAQTQVDVSADVTGRILQITVKEGDMVRKGQFLVQIDPAQFEGAVKRAEALVASSQASLIQAQANRDQAKRSLDRALELQRSNPNLIAQEAVEQAQQQYDVAVAIYQTNTAQLAQARAGLKESQDNLNRTRLYAPISGRVVRLAVEEGEVAVPGTFSRETGLLMTIADMTTIIAQVQVDETDIVRLEPGDSVQIQIDAFPDTSFTGRVTKISNSAKLAASSQTANADRAVDFDVEVVLDAPPAEIRPDLSCTAKIVTDTRKQSLAIPIIALTLREHEALPNEAKEGASAPGDTGAAARTKETEGVFIVADGKAQFRPVKVGIAGEEAFEVLDGLKEGETIVAGPYQAIRDLKDGAAVKSAAPAKGKPEGKQS